MGPAALLPFRVFGYSSWRAANKSKRPGAIGRIGPVIAYVEADMKSNVTRFKPNKPVPPPIGEMKISIKKAA